VKATFIFTVSICPTRNDSVCYNSKSSISQIPSVKSIEITNSTIPVLNLGIFHRFPALRNISVTHCFVSLLHGHSPSGIISLNLSSNHIKHIESSLFFNPVRDTKHDTSHQKNQNQEQHQEINPAASRNEVTIDHEGKSLETNETVVLISNGSGESDTIDISDVKRYSKSNEVLVNDTDESESKRPQSRLQIIDLSHNKISELPKSIFYLKSLKSLRLAGKTWFSLMNVREYETVCERVHSDFQYVSCNTI
jgi:Leucine-rich repeat (LRR) protein